MNGADSFIEAIVLATAAAMGLNLSLAVPAGLYHKMSEPGERSRSGPAKTVSQFATTANDNGKIIWQIDIPVGQ